MKGNYKIAMNIGEGAMLMLVMFISFWVITTTAFPALAGGGTQMTTTILKGNGDTGTMNQEIVGSGMILETNSTTKGLRVIPDQYIYADGSWQLFNDITDIRYNDATKVLSLLVGSVSCDMTFQLDDGTTATQFNAESKLTSGTDVSVGIVKSEKGIEFIPVVSTGTVTKKTSRPMRVGFDLSKCPELKPIDDKSADLNGATIDFATLKSLGHAVTTKDSVFWVNVSTGISILDPDLHITTTNTLWGNANFDYVDIEAGGKLLIGACNADDCNATTGWLNLTVVGTINISGVINGTSAGYHGGVGALPAGQNAHEGYGAGAGDWGGVNGGGAASFGSFGGGGGGGSFGINGNKTEITNKTENMIYNISTNAIFRGAGGGGGWSSSDGSAVGGAGGSGGALLRIKAGIIKVSGTITVNGGRGTDGAYAAGGGGGAGSLILLDATIINITGANISTVGGNGGDGWAQAGEGWGGGGGSGGRIKVLTPTLYNVSSNYNVSGGFGGAGVDMPGYNGGNGTVYFEHTTPLFNMSTYNITVEYPTFVAGLFNMTSDNNDTDTMTINNTALITMNKTGSFFNKTMMKPDTYWFKVTANDSANNTLSSVVVFTVTDTTKPTLATHNLTYASPTGIKVLYNFTDNYQTDSFSINNTANWQINKTGYLENKTYLKPLAKNGLYWLKVTVNDTKNNTQSVNLWINITDSVAPVITYVWSPQNATYNGTSNIDLNFSWTEQNPDQCWYFRSRSDANTTISCSNQTGVSMLAGFNNFAVCINDSTGASNCSYVAFTTIVNATSALTIEDLGSFDLSASQLFWAFYNYTNGTAVLGTDGGSCSITGNITGGTLPMLWDGSLKRYYLTGSAVSAGDNQAVTITCLKTNYQSQSDTDYFNATSATTTITTTTTGGGGGGGGGGTPTKLCGNSICESGETFNNCPADCKQVLINIIPSIIGRTIAPGNSTTVQLAVTSFSNTSFIVDASFVPDETDNSTYKWASFVVNGLMQTTYSFNIDPAHSIPLDVKVLVPAGTPNGNYIFNIDFRTREFDKQVQYRVEVGENVFISTLNKCVVNTGLKDFSCVSVGAILLVIILIIIIIVIIAMRK